MSDDRAALVMLSSEYPPVTGGVATYAYELSRHLGESGHPVIAIVPDCHTTADDKRDAHTKRVNLVDVPLYKREIPKPLWYAAYPVSLLVYILKSWMTAANNRTSPILAAYWFPDGYVAKLVAKRLGTEYYVTAHGLDILRTVNDPRKLNRLIPVLSGAKKVFCVSDFTADKVAEIGIPDHRIVKIPNGVDVRTFYPSSEGEAIRQRHGLGNRPVLFTVGRLVDRKGHASVIESLPEVLKKCPELMYLIGGDGPERERLAELCRQLDVSDSVRFLGSIPSQELRAHYNACDMFVMPNHVGANPWDVEGFGIVFLEAAACGKPVVAGASGGAPDAVAEGETGFCVPEKDVSALAQKLILLLRDRELRTRMGQAGRARVLEEFTWGHIADAYAREMGLGIQA